MSRAAAARQQIAPRRPVEHDLLLTALPHPILVLGEDNRIVYANSAAEAFLSTGIALLKRVRLDEVVGFGCPLLALVEQVRRSGSTVNEYGVEITTPKFHAPKLVDVYGGPSRRAAGARRADAAATQHGHDDRAPADAPRGRTLGIGARLRARPRDQESAVGHPRRRAAARAEPIGCRPLADAAHLLGDRPHPQSRRSHGGVRRRAPARQGPRQHP